MPTDPDAAATRLATIDVGTNTALLLIAEVFPDGTFEVRHRARRVVRLGEGVDRAGVVSEAAMERLRVTLVAYQQVVREWGVTDVVVTGTSASRDAANQEALKAVVHAATGWTYTILSGDMEARWSFLGALSGVSGLDDDAPCVVIDIGGGSTELVVGTPASGPAVRRSLDVGGVRLTERWTTMQPARVAEQEAMAEHVRQELRAADVPVPAGAHLIGASGTVMLLALLHAGIESLEALPSDAHRVSAAVVHQWRRRLFRMDQAAVHALSPALMEGRADIFPVGVLILDEVLRAYDLSEVRASPCSLREGLVVRWITSQQDA